MGESRPASGGSRGGRARGTPNKDKTELRAKTQEAALRFTELKRMEIKSKWQEGWRLSPLGWMLPDEQSRVLGEDIPPALLDSIQPLVEEYEPVVELAIIAVNYENDAKLRCQANAEAAQYLRPKLKSIELLEDPDSLAMQAEKQVLAEKLVSILEAMAAAKRESASGAT